MSIESNTQWPVFAHNIAYLRKKNGLTKKEMAKLLGIGEGSLSKIEKGECPEKLNLRIVYDIERLFGISPSEQFLREIEEE